MEKRLKLFITFFILVVIISGLYLFSNWFSIITGYFTGEDEKVKLAECLAGKNAEFYGSDYCVECEKQREIFGTAFKNINYIDCGKEKENCPNINRIPAWYIGNNDSEIYYGFKNLTELRKISGCADYSERPMSFPI